MDKPWLTPRAVELLDGLLRREDNAIEWGSGRSTCWLAARVGKLISVEADGQWFDRVKLMLAERNIRNVDYRHCPVPDEEERESDYTRVSDELPDRSLGFALVDGAARGTCACNVLPKLQSGAVMVIDNINWYLDYPTRSPGSRTGKGPRDATWARFISETAGWRRIMTSSGVSDTGIWIKPEVRN